ncbi:BspA family leucine-rich repeat surface protein [Campylobacter jejuni]|nr:BspA family leucine-rich repeat surface protein [Campylobacter jejuni]
MSHMFKNTSNFNQALKKWDVSKVEKAEQMFANAKNFNQNLSSWKIAKDTKVDEIFMNSKLATKPPK